VSDKSISGKRKSEHLGRWTGRVFFYVKQYAYSLATRLSAFLWSIWHGSIKWPWFAALLLGGVAMISIGEHAGGLEPTPLKPAEGLSGAPSVTLVWNFYPTQANTGLVWGTGSRNLDAVLQPPRARPLAGE